MATKNKKEYLRRKKALKQEKEYNSQAIFEKAKDRLKTVKAKQREEQVKKKTPDFFLEKIKTIKAYKDFWVRDPYQWVSKHFNYERQLSSFVSHVFCKYKTPPCLYPIFNGHNIANGSLFEIYLGWFITIGQGEPFAKMASAFFTKKEAHLFTTSKQAVPNEAVWWTYATNRDIRKDLTSFLITQQNIAIQAPNFWKSVLDFISKYQAQLDVHTLQDLLDYFQQAMLDPEFSMKGRTLSSIIRLSNNWHNNILKAKNNRYVEWPEGQVSSWVWSKEHEGTWRIREITNSRDLYTEGQKMRHCIGSYVQACVKNQCRIYSMTSTTQFTSVRNLTIEVAHAVVRQARGRLNRKPTLKESAIFHKWATANKLEVSKFI